MWSWKLGHISSGFDTENHCVEILPLPNHWREKRRNREKSLVLSLLDCLPSRVAAMQSVWKLCDWRDNSKNHNRASIKSPMRKGENLVLSLLDCLPSREAGEADWWHQFIAISQKELSEEMARPTENKGKSHHRPKIKENRTNKTSSCSQTRKQPFQV